MLVLTEDDVRRAVSLADTVEAVTTAFAQTATRGTGNLLRRRMYSGTTRLNVLGGVLGGGRLAVKAYTGGPDFGVLLFEADGSLLAFVQARLLSLYRTAGATAAATRILARSDATHVAVLGTGWQARAQLQAVALVRDVTQVRAWSPTVAHVRVFAEEMHEHVGVPVEVAGSAHEAVEGADVVVVATKASLPVVQADMIAPGMHLNLIGANQAQRREASPAVLGACDVISVDDVAQAHTEAGDLLAAVDAKVITWNDVVEFGDIVTGVVPGRTDAQQVTLFKSLGVGIEDVAVTSLAYDRARELGLGTPV